MADDEGCRCTPPGDASKGRAGGRAEGRLYAAQEAANLLGIHRSTLYLAVQKRKLMPDAYTPGGHARFRRETLQRFSDRLTLDSATGGGGTMSRALSSAVASLSHFTQLEPVCEAVVAAAMNACPGIESCMALSYDADCSREQMRMVIAHGFPPRLFNEYHWLRRSPGVDFISLTVARTGAQFICSDVFAEGVDLPEGSLRTFASGGYHACAAFPSVYDGVTLGVLLLLGRTPRSFSEPELAALATLSDVLTTALRRKRRDQATQRQIKAIADMMIEQAKIGQEGSTREGQLLALRRICQQAAKAQYVREWGLSNTDANDETPAPLGDLLRMAASEHAPQRADWMAEDGAAVALATPALGAQGHAAVGAIWRRQDLRSGMELAVLQVYAQTCAAVMGH